MITYCTIDARFGGHGNKEVLFCIIIDPLNWVSVFVRLKISTKNLEMG